MVRETKNQKSNMMNCVMNPKPLEIRKKKQNLMTNIEREPSKISRLEKKIWEMVKTFI